jgi:hypothetical protein
MALDVYNLEFRSWCEEMTIAGYRFVRVAEYPEQLQGLHHRITFHSEFGVKAATGGHRITARVFPPETEDRAVLPWKDDRATALEDVLMLLSIFTGRNVFVCRNEVMNAPVSVVVADPRDDLWGGVIRGSIPYERAPGPTKNDGVPHGDVGLETHLNQVYQWMSTAEWRETYRDGHYLLLFRNALQQRSLESAFPQCWTIWEHLFSVLNDRWMTKRTIENTNATEKIAFLLVRFGVRDRLQDKEQSRLRSLAAIRNRLVHLGRFPESGTCFDDAVLFVYMTEWMVARTLNLLPSEALNTLERFEAFIKNASTHS